MQVSAMKGRFFSTKHLAVSVSGWCFTTRPTLESLVTQANPTLGVTGDQVGTGKGWVRGKPRNEGGWILLGIL